MQTNSPMIKWILSLVALALLASLGFAMYVNAYNKANVMENAIAATDESNRGLVGKYGLKIAEAAQVPAMARDDIQVLIRDAVEGRYGQEGSQAVFQAIREVNPTVDSALYRNIQLLIDAGRTDIQDGQKRLVDQKRMYQTALDSFFEGKLMHVAGYPKMDLSAYKVLSTDRADEAFKTRRETPVQLRSTLP